MPLPDALLALSQPKHPKLAAVPCRLDPVTLARLAALQERIGCRRGPLVREVLRAGLTAIENQLAAEVVIHD